MGDQLGRRIANIGQEGAEPGRTGRTNRPGIRVLKAVEEDEVYPSLGPLLKIARALGVRLGTFLDDHISADPLVVRHCDRAEQFTTHRGAQAPAPWCSIRWGGARATGTWSRFFVELLPNPAATSPSSHEGEEFIVGGIRPGGTDLRPGPDRAGKG
jgi:transcriptional regulator with XRE-family HTH domain